MFCDYHVHTYYSDDCEYPMEMAVKDAIRMKMDEICITDHVDYGTKIDFNKESKLIPGIGVFNVNYPAYFEEIDEMKRKYGQLISLKTGMEFGMQKHTIPKFESLFLKYMFDFIILSCHQVEDKTFWKQEFQSGRSQKEYNEKYYLEIYNVIKEYKNYSVLGHLDLINRYDRNGIYPFEKISDIISEILKVTISDGKGIEVNTSTIRYGMGEWSPSWNILKLYKDLGGEIITLGSDCHKSEHLGAYIRQVKSELKKYGFKYMCTYDKMEPIFHEL